MSLGIFSFITLLISCVSFVYYEGIVKGEDKYTGFSKNLFILCLIFSIFNILIGIYFYTIWDDYINELTKSFFAKNIGAQQLPIKFWFIKIWPYILFISGIGFSLLYYDIIKKQSLKK